MMNKIIAALNYYVPNPIIELDYEKDYELLIATVLSAQSTDRRVNLITRVLFDRYNLYTLADAEIEDIKSIIKSVGTFNRKAIYLKEIAKSLIKDYDGVVPNNREYLESLPGVGRKTANVVLKHLYNVSAIAVDTHVERVSKRLGLAPKDANVKEVEKSLMKLIPKDEWSKVGDQILLFGRYHCTSKKPKCDNCLLKDICKKDSL